MFACVKKEGLKRLDAEGIVSLAGTETLSVRRRARTVGKRLGLAVFEDLREASRMRAIGLAKRARCRRGPDAREIGFTGDAGGIWTGRATAHP